MANAKRRTAGELARCDPSDYVVIGVSMYADALTAADAAIERCKKAGVRDMSRSRLIRIALAKLDVEALIADERSRVP